MTAESASRTCLRHALATIAYRTRKIVRDSSSDFAAFDAGHGARKPVEILSHMSEVLHHAQSFLAAIKPRRIPVGTWDDELKRFFEILRQLDDSLQSGAELKGRTEEQLLQGPLADALTHVGQLAMLRRMAGAPLPKEDFDEAKIHVGDVSERDSL